MTLILENNTPKDAFLALKEFIHSLLTLVVIIECSDNFIILYLPVFTLLYLLPYSL